MRALTRRFARLLAIFLIASALLFVLVHTAPLKRAASRAAVALVERYLGGEAAFQVFDYRLWRGEVRVEGFSWTSSGAAVRAREVLIHLSLRERPVEVHVAEPDIRITLSASASDKEVALPAIVLGARLSIANGAVRIEWPQENRTLELASIDAGLVPEEALSRATFEAASGRLRDGELDVGFGPARARLRLEATGIQIDEARISKGGSFVTASGRLAPLSPLGAELRFEHSIEGSLLSTFDPRIALAGLLEGEGALRRRAGSEDEGEGVLRARTVSVSSIGPFAVEASWRFAGGAASADVSFESLESARLAPLSSRISGRLGLSVENLDFENPRGEGLISLRPPARGGLPGVPLRGDVAIRVESRQIAFTARRLTVPGAEIEASGTIGESLEARYRARIENLGEVAPLLSVAGIPPSPILLRGPLDLEGTVEGPLGAPSIEARIASDAVGVGESTFAVTGRAAFRGARVEVYDLTLRGAEEGSIVVDGAIPTSPGGGAFALDARIDSLPLAGVVEAISSGRLTATLAVSGELSRPRVEIRAVLASDSTATVVPGRALPWSDAFST